MKILRMIEAIGYKCLTLIILISEILFALALIAMALTFAGCEAQVEVSSKPTKPVHYPPTITLTDKDGNYYHFVKRSGLYNSYDAHFLGTNITWKVE